MSYYSFSPLSISSLPLSRTRFFKALVRDFLKRSYELGAWKMQYIWRWHLWVGQICSARSELRKLGRISNSSRVSVYMPQIEISDEDKKGTKVNTQCKYSSLYAGWSSSCNMPLSYNVAAHIFIHLNIATSQLDTAQHLPMARDVSLTWFSPMDRSPVLDKAGAV